MRKVFEILEHLLYNILYLFQSEKAATPVSKSATPTSSGNTTPGPMGGLKQGVLKAPHLGE